MSSNVSIVSHQHCANHLEREAVARCPQCRGYFCRECISEHEGRVLCSRCLEQLASATTSPRRENHHLFHAGACVAGILVGWMFFYFGGRLLVMIPASFHEGTVWKESWIDQE